MFGSGSDYWQQKFIGLNISHVLYVFQPLPPADIMATVEVVHDEPDTKPSKEVIKEPCPTFGPHPNTKAADFDFQEEVEHFPFKINLGDVHLDKEHQDKFIDLIYGFLIV